MDNFICESCGAEVPGNAQVCPNCGKEFTGVRCPRCSFSGSEQMFQEGCPACGYRPGQTFGEEGKKEIHNQRKQASLADQTGKRSSAVLWGLLVLVAVLLFFFFLGK
ncbi:MAG: zinc-ribbon domain-containing protein [Spirochaetales bacterium]|nr:zinc-ribbon domain-containing protein [Spirochaetales bacterium]